MPSGRPAAPSPEMGVSPLTNKLEKLEMMLEITEEAERDPGNLSVQAVRKFNDRLCALMEEIQEMNRTMASSCHEASLGLPPEAVESIKGRIQATLERLMKANARLVTSIRARQEIIGEKIMQLKRGKDFLKSSKPNIDPDPGLIDSRI
jgi:hypothetical protein